MRIISVALTLIMAFGLLMGGVQLRHYQTGELIRAEDNTNYSNWTVGQYNIKSDPNVADVIRTKSIYMRSSPGAVTIVIETAIGTGTPDVTVYAVTDFGVIIQLGTITGEQTVRYNIQDYNELTSPFEWFYVRIVENTIQSTDYKIDIYVLEDL